jgi:hypothetical protein
MASAHLKPKSGWRWPRAQTDFTSFGQETEARSYRIMQDRIGRAQLPWLGRARDGVGGCSILEGGASVDADRPFDGF